MEQPNGNFADTIARQFFIDARHVALFTRLVNSRDAQIAAIAAKGLKEVRYHLRFSRGWLERLGNGTEVSAQKMQQAVDGLWRFTGELFLADALELALVEQGIAVDPATCRRSGRVRFTPRCLTPGCRSRKRRRFATAVNRDCTVNISGRCWRKCSICNALIPVSSGNRRWLCNVSPISHPQKSMLSGRC